MSKSVYTFLFLIVFLFHFQSLSGYSLKAIKTTNTTMITSIIQDESDFVWIGGSNGLLRFDSYAPISINDGVNEENIGYIKKIYKSNEEHTFLLATNEGLFFYDYIIDEFKIVNECLRGYDVRSIILSHDKQWYVATNRGVYIFNEQFEFIDVITTKSGLVNEQIYTVVEDRDNNVLIASSGGVDRLIKDAQGNYNVVSVLKGGGVRFLVIDKNDDIWYNVNGKIYWAHRRAWLNNVAKEAHNISDNIECVVALNLQNEVWVGTRGNGILRYEITQGKEPEILPSILIDKSRNAEINNTILSLYQDTNKDIWIGTINGLYLYTCWGSTFNTLKHSDRNPNTLSINMISSIYAAPDNTIWLGTSYGINSLIWDENRTKYTIKHYIDNSDDDDIIGQNRILMIAPCSDTQFLISTKQGLKYFNPITKTYFTTNNLTEAYSKYGMRYVRSYYTSPTGDIYMAFNEGGIGVWLKSQGAFAPIRWEGKASGIYRGIVQDQSGKLWVAADGKGLYCLTLSDDKLSVQHEELYSRTQFNNQHVTNLYIDSKHTIWAGTFNGLFSMNIEQKGFEAFPLSQSNTPLYISSIIEDKNQHIWVSSIRGIYKIASRESVSYYEVDNKSDISKLWYIIGHDRDEEGNIYIGGTNGLIYYNPLLINLDRRTIQPYISRLLIDNTPDFVNCQKLNYGDNKVTFPSNSKQIVFEISALYYPNPHVIRYAYKLDGVDKEWIYTDSYHRSISYNNLPGGNYSLQVKSTTPTGKWSDNVVSFEFIVQPSPFMTWYAILIYIVLGAFIIFLIVKVLCRR